MKFQEVLANLDDTQAFAVYHALAQWWDNERTRNDLEEWESSKDCRTLAQILEALDCCLAGQVDPNVPCPLEILRKK